MPSYNHAVIQANLIGEFLHHREFRVASELTLEIDGIPYTPDISVYPKLALDLRRDIIRRPDPPLLVVEILSPSQGYQEVMDKVEVYFRHGVKSVWIVSPPIHNLTILAPGSTEQSYHDGIAKDPITGVRADLATVFA